MTWTESYAVEERWRRIAAHQAADPKLKPLLRFLRGDLTQLKKQEVKQLAKIADQYEVDHRGVLLYLSYTSRYSPMGPGFSTSRGSTNQPSSRCLAYVSC